MEYDLVSKWNQKTCHGMGTEQTILASTCQFPHGLCATVKLNMANVLKEVNFFVFVCEVCGHVRELRVVRVALDEGREEGDKL